MNKSIFISGLLLTLALGSCYKDKGNYGYKDVNDFEVTVTPAPADKETNIYLVNQPNCTGVGCSALVTDSFSREKPMPRMVTLTTSPARYSKRAWP